MKKSKKIWLEMLAFLLVFGMTVIGCTGSKLEGTWVAEYNNNGDIKFNNGRFEFFDPQSGAIGQNGTYTTHGNKLTLQGESPITYSVKGSTLTLFHENGDIMKTFTRKLESDSKNSNGSEAPDSQNSSNPQTTQSASKTYYATTNLRVRSEPDTSKDNQVGRVPEGDSVELLEVGRTETIADVTAPWYRVRIADGTTGWVFSGYLSDTRDPLIGTWEGSGGETYKFGYGNFEIFRNGHLEESGIYSATGGSLTLTFRGATLTERDVLGAYFQFYDYSVNGNTLTLTVPEPVDYGWGDATPPPPSTYTRK